MLTYHTSIHAAITPHIKAIIIFLEIDEKLRAFEISRSYTHIVFCAWVVEFSKTPIDQAKLYDTDLSDQRIVKILL
jgi:hypothetical protein